MEGYLETFALFGLLALIVGGSFAWTYFFDKDSH
jgi:hypothetical protein